MLASIDTPSLHPELDAFVWQRDGSGYDWSPDRASIVRRRGVLTDYRPSSVRPGLHRIFAQLHTQVLAPDEHVTDEEEAWMRSAPFHLRRFPTLPAALFAFTCEFGPLGTDDSGPSILSETLGHIEQRQEQLRAIVNTAGNETARALNQAAPMLRPRIETDADGRRRVALVPESLWAWLWLRSAHDHATGVDWTGPPCLFCGMPLARGRGAFNRNREFCSPRCKTAFGRLPKEEQSLRRSAARGLSRGSFQDTLAEIAPKTARTSPRAARSRRTEKKEAKP